jgi:hypothetical protein
MSLARTIVDKDGGEDHPGPVNTATESVLSLTSHYHNHGTQFTSKKAAVPKATQAARTKRRASTELQSPRKRPATQSSTRTLGEDELSEAEVFRCSNRTSLGVSEWLRWLIIEQSLMFRWRRQDRRRQLLTLSKLRMQRFQQAATKSRSPV